MAIASRPGRRQRGLFLALLATALVGTLAGTAVAGPLDDIGVTALRNADPTLIGSGIGVIQVEAPYQTANTYQVNPASVNLAASKFTYVSSAGTIYSSSTYVSPNSGGTASLHANSVGVNFYGNATSGVSPGVAPGVSTIDNYDANYYVNTIVGANWLPSQISSSLHDARVVNQSFIFNSGSPSYAAVEDPVTDQYYDNYAARHNVLFVNGAGNGTPSSSPGTCYNGISVAVINGASTVGPTLDNGRSKPDITAPGGATSYSAPYVSGAAAVLMQAAARGDGGMASQTITNAGDIRTIKALLLNGATKQVDWGHTSTQPLDLRYGAGLLNVFNSWKQMCGGEQAISASQSVTTGSVLHAPSTASHLCSLTGWDFADLTTSNSKDVMNDYVLVAPQQSAITLTATLVWNRQATNTPSYPIDINNLDLFLYDLTTGTLVGQSVSTVDNVEHLYVTGLNAGDTYAIQVWKEGGSGVVSNAESYSLAYSMVAVPEPSVLLTLAVSAMGMIVWNRWSRRKGHPRD